MSPTTLHRVPISAELQSFADEVGAEGPVRVVGGRTNLELGRREHVVLARELTAPSAVVDVQPAELIVRCGAATPVAELDAALAGARLQCVLDPADPLRSTVGGVLSVGRSGVRRLRHGHVRDVLLEAQYVSADGRLRRAGAPVVKNVTGFDVCRLLVGSLGTIAAIGEVVLRCQPAPDVRVWFRGEGADPWEIRRRLFRPSSILWDGTCTYVQLEGSSAEVAAERGVLGPGWSECGAPVLPIGRAQLSLGEQRALRVDRSLHVLEGGEWLVEVGVGVVHGVERSLPGLSPQVLTMQRQVKDAFDPAGRMNPGVLPW